MQFFYRVYKYMPNIISMEIAVLAMYYYSPEYKNDMLEWYESSFKKKFDFKVHGYETFEKFISYLDTLKSRYACKVDTISTTSKSEENNSNINSGDQQTDKKSTANVSDCELLSNDDECDINNEMNTLDDFIFKDECKKQNDLSKNNVTSDLPELIKDAKTQPNSINALIKVDQNSSNNESPIKELISCNSPENSNEIVHNEKSEFKHSESILACEEKEKSKILLYAPINSDIYLNKEKDVNSSSNYECANLVNEYESDDDDFIDTNKTIEDDLGIKYDVSSFIDEKTPENDNEISLTNGHCENSINLDEKSIKNECDNTADKNIDNDYMLNNWMDENDLIMNELVVHDNVNDNKNISKKLESTEKKDESNSGVIGWADESDESIIDPKETTTDSQLWIDEDLEDVNDSLIHKKNEGYDNYNKNYSFDFDNVHNDKPQKHHDESWNNNYQTDNYSYKKKLQNKYDENNTYGLENNSYKSKTYGFNNAETSYINKHNGYNPKENQNTDKLYTSDDVPTADDTAKRVAAKLIKSHVSRFYSCMDFSFSPQELEIRENVKKFAINVIKPKVPTMEKNKKMELSIIKKLFEQGFMGIEVSEEYGGSNMSFTASIIIIEELARVDPCTSLLVDIQNTLSNRLIDKYASKKQKDKYLKAAVQSDIISFCLSEESSGSDAFSLKTIAKPSKNGFVINGSKLWISNSKEAGYFLVLANANPEKGYKGISTFIIDSDTPGVYVGKPEDKLGLIASSTCPVVFENVELLKENLIGKLGEGYKHAITTLEVGRIGIGAQMVGAANSALDHTLEYLKERKQFNTAIWDFQAVRHDMAIMYTDLEAARIMVYTCARALENNQNISKLSAMAKLTASETANRITSKCIDLMGGVGFTKDYPVEKFYRDCKVGTIYEGTSNIMLNTIAKLL
ncbi:hypothetical protein A3Q56_04580 [Intoshia linei]|uniref:Short/branched chain specific acyl-CoA dehydrogenase, mitochondrial n=1 Tax=Intoshia linei TaxID=1819745 RepID=A0A177B1T5_9BILA|nr:hypothetical protein A3Q56_04580 [Intoshia linei]